MPPSKDKQFNNEGYLPETIVGVIGFGGIGTAEYFIRYAPASRRIRQIESDVEIIQEQAKSLEFAKDYLSKSGTSSYETAKSLEVGARDAQHDAATLASTKPDIAYARVEGLGVSIVGGLAVAGACLLARYNYFKKHQ